MVSTGGVLSTVKLLPGPAVVALFPAVSLAVPDAMLMLSVPSPVMPLMRTVGEAVVSLSTLTLPLAVPVAASVTLAACRLIVFVPL